MTQMTHLKKAEFLAEYARTCSVQRAANAAGVDRQMHYRWLKNDPSYKERLAAAGELAVQYLEDVAVERATIGNSDTMLIFPAEGCQAAEVPRQYPDGARWYPWRPADSAQDRDCTRANAYGFATAT